MRNETTEHLTAVRFTSLHFPLITSDVAPGGALILPWIKLLPSPSFSPPFLYIFLLYFIPVYLSCCVSISHFKAVHVQQTLRVYTTYHVHFIEGEIMLYLTQNLQ